MRWAGLAVLAGCAPTTSLPIDVPPPVTLIGTVRADGVDVPRPSSGLLPADGAHLFYTERDQPWMMFGYEPAALASFELPEASTLAVTPVRAAAKSEACWRLPPPSWSAPLDPSAQGRSIPPLIADWARQCTPEALQPKSWFDVRCGAENVLNCGRHPVRDDEHCLASLVDVECRTVAADIAIESDGRACPIESERPPTCSATEGPEGDPRWICENGCIFDFYRPRSQPLVVDSAPIGAANAGSNALDDFDNIRLINLAAGSVDSLGVSGDLVLATVRSPKSASTGFCDKDHPEIVRSQVRVDAETLAVTSSLALDGRCVTRMVPDPVGGGLLAGFHVGTEVGIARIDRQGNWVAQKMLPRSLPVGAKDVFQVPSILTSSSAILLFEQVNSDGGDGFTFVHLLDRATLEPDPALPVRTYPGSAFAAEWIDGTRYVILRRGTQSEQIATVRGEPVTGRGFMLPSSRAISAASIGAGRVLFADSGLSKSLVLGDLSRTDAERTVRVSRIFERTAIPIEIRMIGDPPSRGIVSALFPHDVAQPEVQAALAVVDVHDDDVRVLPGLVELTVDGGRWYGAILQLALDRRGRVWGMAPWVGRLVRITLP